MLDIDKIKKVHCIGIGGVGLSAIADVLLFKGIEVSGSDLAENELTDRLKKDGAEIFNKHEGKNVEGADIVVYSAAVGEDNPELMRARSLKIPILTRAQMLGLLMTEYENSIAVAGTHGKTTTTSMISLILEAAGLEPTILVGGNLNEIGGNVKAGSSHFFVTEACEYMDSFLELRPRSEIILNIDSDHLDYFKDIDHIADSFKQFTSLVPNDGKIFAYKANPFVSRAIKGLENVISFGIGEDCDYAAKNIDFDADGLPGYELWFDGRKQADIELAIPGEYNILNSLAAIAYCHDAGVPFDICKDTLKRYEGTARRFDVRGKLNKGTIVIDDYAHHPTEIRAALKATRNLRRERIWCIFQPHTYTRTIALFDEFAEAFEDADKIIITDIYAAREKNMHKISSLQLAEAVRENFPEKDVRFEASFEDIVKKVHSECGGDDVVMTMGAGDIYKVGEMLLEFDRNPN